MEAVFTSGEMLAPVKEYTPQPEKLAQILTRQGKNERAIEVYEKLILKIPEKKAYFAACIADLQK